MSSRDRENSSVPMRRAITDYYCSDQRHLHFVPSVYPPRDLTLQVNPVLLIPPIHRRRVLLQTNVVSYFGIEHDVLD
jgi:hypothetical protein